MFGVRRLVASLSVRSRHSSGLSVRQRPALAAALAILLRFGPPALAAPEDAAPVTGVVSAVGAELGRWGVDAAAFVTAPVSWEESDWGRFGALSAGVGALMLADESVYHWVGDHRTDAGDRFSRAIAPFGQEYAYCLSAGLLAWGLASSDTAIRDTGRDAVQALVLGTVLVNLALKPVIGRQRPYVTDGETVFHPFSWDASFPSGHATEAFALASVLSMHSEGWVVPTVAYTLASLVAVSRVQQSMHFTSDVFAGAVLGASIGRFVVSRHRASRDDPSPRVGITLLPIPHGLAVRASW